MKLVINGGKRLVWIYVLLKSHTFSLHTSSFKDRCFKYTQFRNLHRRFYTDNKLYKMGIKRSDWCTFCEVDSGSIEHILLYYPAVVKRWDEVQEWALKIVLLQTEEKS